MGNIVDYARGEFRGFDELRFSAVDSLVLSELAYVRMPEVVPGFERSDSVDTVPIGQALRAEDYPHMFATGSKEVNDARHDLLVAVAESPRYRGMRVGEYAEHTDAATETQFAAMTFDLSDCAGVRDGASSGGLLHVSFRGTNNTLIGWKEDFNMAVRCPVPSQEQAAAYLASIGARAAGRFRLVTGGHSKGGNLAVYAAMKTPQRSVERIYSHDGPGFMGEVTAGDEFRAVAGRIEKTVPESSIIGMLMSTVSAPNIVASSANGIMQHMAMSWQVEDGAFVTKDELTSTAKLMDRTLDAWMERFSEEQRERAIDQCYEILASSGYDSFAELSDHWTQALPVIADAAKRTDRDTRALIIDIIKALPATAARTMFETVAT